MRDSKDETEVPFPLYILLTIAFSLLQTVCQKHLEIARGNSLAGNARHGIPMLSRRGQECDCLSLEEVYWWERLKGSGSQKVLTSRTPVTFFKRQWLRAGIEQLDENLV